MKKPLSICIVSDDYLPAATGVGVHIKLIAPELARRGYRVCVITTRRKGESEVEHWDGVTIYRVTTVKAFGFYQAVPSTSTIRGILKDVNADVVHYHYIGWMLLKTLSIAEDLGIPNIYTYHMTEVHLTQPIPLRAFRGLVARGIVNFCNRMDEVIAVSKKFAERLPEKGVRTNVRYISNPVVFDNISNVVPAERTPGFTILYAGRLGVEKNIGYLIKSFAALLKTVPKAVLWIAGRGPEGAALDVLCRQLEICGSVRFLGFLDHPSLARHYAACDVFVLPSIEEVQPLVAMEAMWFGCPIIVTSAILAAEEMVEQGVNGYIVDSDSIEDLTLRLEYLASHPDEVSAQGVASSSRANAYRPELVVSALEQAYCDLSMRRNVADRD